MTKTYLSKSASALCAERRKKERNMIAGTKQTPAHNAIPDWLKNKSWQRKASYLIWVWFEKIPDRYKLLVWIVEVVFIEVAGVVVLWWLDSMGWMR